MPVILASADFAAWLDVERTDRTDAETPLRPVRPDAMMCWSASTAVNQPANDGPSLVEVLAQSGAPDGETEIRATWAAVEIAAALAATNPIYLTGDAASLTRFRGA